jgi:hypothetical protein
MRTTKNPRTQILRLRLTERERRGLENMADQEEKTLSQLARDLMREAAILRQTTTGQTTGQ